MVDNIMWSRQSQKGAVTGVQPQDKPPLRPQKSQEIEQNSSAAEYISLEAPTTNDFFLLLPPYLAAFDLQDKTWRQ